MKKKTHRTKKCYKPLPPHTWEAHTTASHGEVNKQLIIAIITIGAIVVLAGLLFFTDVFVGKAIDYGAPATVGEGGLYISGTEDVHTPFTVPIMANIALNKKSVAVQFEFEYGEGSHVSDCLNHPNNPIFDVLDAKVGDAAVHKFVSCANNVLKFEYAWLCNDKDCSNALSGIFTIAEIIMDAGVGDYDLTAKNINVLSLDDNVDLITSETGPVTITIKEEVEPEELICVPNQFYCLSDVQSARCGPEGKVYDSVTDCAVGEFCENGECKFLAVEICDDGKNNDKDWYVDCFDEDCAGKSCGEGCVCSSELTEIDGKAVGTKIETKCDDTLDNDGDGKFDCDDEDCANDANCVVAGCNIYNLDKCTEDTCLELFGTKWEDEVCVKIPFEISCVDSDSSEIYTETTDFSDYVTGVATEIYTKGFTTVIWTNQGVPSVGYDTCENEDGEKVQSGPKLTEFV